MVAVIMGAESGGDFFVLRREEERWNLAGLAWREIGIDGDDRFAKLQEEALLTKMVPGEFARLEFDFVQRCADVVHKLLLLFCLRVFIGNEIDADVAWRNDGVEGVSALIHGNWTVMEQIRDVGGRRDGEACFLHGNLDGEIAVGVF